MSSLPISLNRRTFLGTAATLVFSAALPSWGAGGRDESWAKAQLEKLERDLNGRLGLFALNTADGTHLAHRADERFPLCSTFKVLAASAILAKSAQVEGLLQRRIHYERRNLVEHSPITQQHLADGMTVAALCAAAIRYSDNTAGNLLIRTLGGPPAVTAFARSIGDTHFRLDRWETALNTAIPGDPRDTSTPRAMADTLRRLVLGDTLSPQSRDQLRNWLLGNTTGAARIKAGLPGDWKIGDKTGGGQYGTANDLAVIWPPQRKPVLLALYTTQHKQDAQARGDVIAAATRVVVDWLGNR